MRWTYTQQILIMILKTSRKHYIIINLVPEDATSVGHSTNARLKSKHMSNVNRIDIGLIWVYLKYFSLMNHYVKVGCILYGNVQLISECIYNALVSNSFTTSTIFRRRRPDFRQDYGPPPKRTRQDFGRDRGKYQNCR